MWRCIGGGHDNLESEFRLRIDSDSYYFYYNYVEDIKIHHLIAVPGLEHAISY